MATKQEVTNFFGIHHKKKLSITTNYNVTKCYQPGNPCQCGRGGGGSTRSFWASSDSQQVHFIIYLFTWSLINLLKLFYFIIFFIKKLQGIQFLSYQNIKCVRSELLVLIVWNYQLSKITWTSPIFCVVRLLPLVREPGNQTIYNTGIFFQHLIYPSIK